MCSLVVAAIRAIFNAMLLGSVPVVDSVWFDTAIGAGPYVVGQKINFVESVPVSVKDKVRASSHSIVHLRLYRPESRSYWSFDPKLLHNEQPERYFDNLPGRLTATPCLALERPSPGRRGLTFDFTPKEAGTFVIRSRWELKEGDREVVGPPVLIQVRPDPARNARLELPTATAQRQK